MNDHVKLFVRMHPYISIVSMYVKVINNIWTAGMYFSAQRFILLVLAKPSADGCSIMARAIRPTVSESHGAADVGSSSFRLAILMYFDAHVYCTVEKTIPRRNGLSCAW